MAGRWDKVKLALGLSDKPKAAKTTQDVLGKMAKTNMDATNSWMDKWYNKKKLPQERTRLYRTYDEIDDLVPEIGGFLDIVSSESTQLNEERGHRLLHWHVKRPERAGNIAAHGGPWASTEKRILSCLTASERVS